MKILKVNKFLILALFFSFCSIGFCEESYALPPETSIVVVCSDGCVPCIYLKQRLDGMGVKYAVSYDYKAYGCDSTPTTIAYKKQADGTWKETGRFIMCRTKEELVVLLGLKAVKQ